MADGKVVIETDLDSSGIEKGLKSLGSITAKGLKTATTAIAGTATALGGVATAAVKVGSDFEAQMSRVKAISGATGEEFEKLRNQAIELGADTAFSASEAAQGMENLAAAGFTTNEIMSAMPGMLDLAAASGEDLANSADIAASTLRGFGLEASEAGHVADVLAENANRTNSSVAETGEAMKYIAPVARAAGISMEETAAAIGIMANAGIQGSQAGTTLRGALSRLSKPTDVMQQAMDELGVSFYDSEGKMKSLSEQVGMLQDAMEGMTDEQKNNYLVTLYGQEALSGMLALINEGPESLSDLTEAYEACDGAAQKAATTMQDNLKGAVEALSGSAETLGIVFYDSVSGSLKDAVEVVNESVDNITDAFNNGGMDAAISAAGDEFANLATAAASHAPEMVDVAVNFIQSFADGIVSNRGKLIGAAGEAAEAIASGLAELLHSELREPVEDAIDAISDSLSSGGLKKAGETAVDTLENVIDIAGKLADAALPPLTDALDFAANHIDLVAASATTAFVAFKGYKVINDTTSALSKGIKAWKTASAAVDAYNVVQMACTAQGIISNATLTVGQAAVGLLTGKISLATAAQTLWNTAMTANPIGLVITAVGALAAAIGVCVLASDDAAEATNGLTEKQKENIDASREAIQSIEDEAAARQKNLNASTAEIDQAEVLWQELQKCVDANGQVKDGYEQRAAYITGELSSALGTEISMTDGVIDNYGELESSIYDVIAAKKAEAMLSAMESDYAAAMEEQAEKAANLASEYEKLSDIKEKQAGIEAELAAEAENATQVMTHTGDAVTVYSDKYYELKNELNEVNGSLEEQQAKFDAANAAMQDNQQIISDYNMVADAAMSGSTDAINSALAQIRSGLDATLESGSAAAIEQANTTAGTLTSILQGEADGLYALQDQTKDSLAETMGVALNQVGTGAEEMKQVLSSAGKEGSAQIVAAMAQAKISGVLSNEAEAGLESFIAGFDGLDDKTKEVWAQAWYGALEGLEGFEELKDPAVDGADAFLESLRTALEVHSPSQAVKSIFSQVWPGAVEGLNEGQESLNTTGTSVVQNFLTSLSSSGLLDGAKQIGSNIMSFFGIGVESQTENSRAQGKANADAANQGAGSVNPASTGSRFGSLLGGGIGGMVSLLFGKGKSLGDNAKSGADSVDPSAEGSNFGSNYANSISSKRGMSQNAGRTLASSAEGSGGLRSVSTRSAGHDFGSGFGGGITSAIGNAVSAAASLASSALAKIKDVLDIHSPSREGRLIGRNLGESVGLGEEDAIGFVEKSSEKLSDAALKSLDMSAISARMRETMALNTDRIAKSFALESTNTILSRQQSEMLMRMSDEDMERLALRMGRVTADEMNKKQNSRPIYLGTDRIDKPLPKGAVPRI